MFKVTQAFRAKFFKKSAEKIKKKLVLQFLELYLEMLIPESLYLTSWNSSWYDIRKKKI